MGWLVPATFFAASGGILYEVFLGALGSYLFGDSVKVFSLTTGAYMFAMGVGAFAVRSDVKRPVQRLMATELALTVLHLTVPFLVWTFFVMGWVTNLAFWISLLVSGTLVGTEIPLILAIVREKEGSSDARVHQVLAADYVGALIASLLFGFWLLPKLGLIATAAFSALLEVVAAYCLWAGQRNWADTKGAKAVAAGVVFFSIVSLAGFAGATRIEQWLEESWTSKALSADYVHSEWTGYNHISLLTIPQGPDGAPQNLLLLNGQVQWTTGRYLQPYHESLVIPASEAFHQASGKNPEKVLIIGGGDGFAADRFRKFYGTGEIKIFELDPRMPELAQSIDFWKSEGGDIFAAPGVETRFGDAYTRLLHGKPEGPFDVIVFDLPVASTPAIARFFTPGFLSRLHPWLSPKGVLALQTSSQGGQTFGRDHFVCTIEHSLRKARFTPETLLGTDQDFYTLASSEKLQWPESSAKLPGKYLKTGKMLVALRTDPWDRFGDSCPTSLPEHSLLRPVLLEY